MIQNLNCPSCSARVPSHGGPVPDVICPRCYKAILVPEQLSPHWGSAPRNGNTSAPQPRMWWLYRKKKPGSLGEVSGAVSLMLFGVGVFMSLFATLCLHRDASGHLVVIHHVSRGGTVTEPLGVWLVLVGTIFGLSFAFSLIWLLWKASER